MDTSAFIHHLTALSGYSGQIAHIEEIPPRKAVYGNLERPLAL